jgi:hypothetical protein
MGISHADTDLRVDEARYSGQRGRRHSIVRLRLRHPNVGGAYSPTSDLVDESLPLNRFLVTPSSGRRLFDLITLQGASHASIRMRSASIRVDRCVVRDHSVTFARIVGGDAVLVRISDHIPDPDPDPDRGPGLHLLCDPHTDVPTGGRRMALHR